MVVIDSLNGYLNSMPEERFLTTHLHELFAFLNQSGVLTIIVVAQHGMMAAGARDGAIDVSYLADSVLLFRYYEAAGEVNQAISVFKKTNGPARTEHSSAHDRRVGVRGRRTAPSVSRDHDRRPAVPRRRFDPS